MSKAQWEAELEELKAEYLRIQFDLEKVESVGRDIGPLEQKLIRVETEIQELNDKLRG
ncbi:SE1832 family protein [Alkalihalobacillus pseudalcaliphilus]|uniref:SE1832 family protein n=1 Tax=Alkalihalobacillus pseudalcaliphilus TaxID=79884 RepID=UPI000A8A54D1|nr:SE1832 family protein [Alkalihalobacillus pseudalcaliphilus]